MPQLNQKRDTFQKIQIYIYSYINYLIYELLSGSMIHRISSVKIMWKKELVYDFNCPV